MKKNLLNFTVMVLVAIIAAACQEDISSPTVQTMSTTQKMVSKSAQKSSLPFIKGVDLSYVNELEDVGVTYTANGSTCDAYEIMNEYGANLVRLRLWHNPTWTSYSTLTDVKKSIQRAKSLDMNVLLDFHYSDYWTDPEQSLVPAAWAAVVDDTETLADSIYNYTYATLTHLAQNSYLPEMVQIGNETNYNFLVSDNSKVQGTVNYARNATLFNAGLKAVADFNSAYSKDIKTVLHIAQDPSNAKKWVDSLKVHNISNFDMLGLSYYPQWQGYTPAELGNFAASLYSTYGIRVLVAETGHIWTRKWNDNSHNLMSKMAPGYPEKPCPQLQKDFIIEVKEALRNNNGAGFIAWEPTWVSANNVTLWGTGSNWENVTFFDFNNALLDHGGIEALSENNVAVTFTVDMSNAGTSAVGYITGEFTTNDDGSWQIFPMKQVGTSSTYTFTTYLSQGQTGAYYYLSDSTWTARETVPSELQGKWDDRLYEVSTSATSQNIVDAWVNSDE